MVVWPKTKQLKGWSVSGCCLFRSLAGTANCLCSLRNYKCCMPPEARWGSPTIPIYSLALWLLLWVCPASCSKFVLKMHIAKWNEYKFVKILHYARVSRTDRHLAANRGERHLAYYLQRINKHERHAHTVSGGEGGREHVLRTTCCE